MVAPLTFGAGWEVGPGWTLGPLPVVESGLQLYLDANNTTSYSGTGTTWYDLSGNGNDVAMQNSGDITYTSSGGGYFGTGAQGWFSNPSPTSNIPTGSTSYTVSTWVQFPSGWTGRGYSPAMVTIGANATYNQINDFGLDQTGYLYVNWFGTPLVTSSWTPGAPGSNWANFVSQWDGTTRKIWYNGVLQGNDTIGPTLGNTSDILIGNDYSGWSNWLNGNIGQVLIYNRALTSSELAQNFNAVKSRYGV
jgi:hypothetical protein